MKPHEFSELVNDIRFITTHTLNMENLLSADRHLYYILSRHTHLQELSCNDVHKVWVQCIKYAKTQQLRAQIVKVLKDCGIGPGPVHLSPEKSKKLSIRFAEKFKVELDGKIEPA